MDDETTVSRTVASDRVGTMLPGPDRRGTDRVDLPAIGGRTLAEPVVPSTDVPTGDRSTMDGYALSVDDELPLEVVGEVGPGEEPPSMGPGQTVAAATGAACPDRATAVLVQERAIVEDGHLVAVEGTEPLSPGQNLYPAGTTAAAGEELVPAGTRLGPRHATLFRDVGIDSVSVLAPLSVSLVPTGDEIHAGREPDRDSAMLAGLLAAWGHEASIADPVPDDEAAVRAAIDEAVAAADLVITTGGTSVGRGDHVGSVLADHDPVFRGVGLRPGRPTTAASVRGTPVVALPGKPIAAHTAAVLLLGPALSGGVSPATRPSAVAVDLEIPDSSLEFAVPVTVESGRATPLGHPDSTLQLYEDRFRPGRVASSTRVALADGVVLTTEALAAGDRCRVVPYEVVE